MNLSSKAFTLVELMIVIAIIGILAAALFPSMNTYIVRSKDTSRLSQGRLIITGNESLRADIGRFANPASEANCWGWDTPIDGTFLPELKNYTKIPNVDGTNPHYTSGSISCGWIQYARYPVGDWGCPTDKGNYYLMIIQRVNSSVVWDNPGFSCPGRTWVETRGGLAPPIIYGQYEN